MADKETKLSIVIRTVDKATARIKEINDRLDAATKPVRDFKEAVGDLREKSGFDAVLGGISGVGSALMDVVGKVAMIGGVISTAVVGVLSLVDGFDDLGDKAEKLGVSVDFIAQMRYAAERSGASVEELDAGLQSFTTSLGQARAGTGKMTGFLKIVSPALLKQMKAANGNEAAFALLADAMAKIEDPAKRAAFAAKTVGNAALSPLLARGAKGIEALRNRYADLAGSQEEAAAAAGPVDDSLKDLKATTDGLKASIVKGLAPSLKVVVDRLAEWFVKNRADVERWASQVGDRIPAAVDRIVRLVQDAVKWVTDFVDRVGGIENVALGAAAVMAGPLLSAVVTLGAAMLATPFGAWLAGFAAIAALVASVVDEVELFKKALDTSNEVLLQDSVEMSDAEFAKAHPEVASEKADGLLLAQGKMSLAEYEKKYPGKGTQETADFFAYIHGVAPPPQEAKVTIDIANAPRGTRVTADPQSTATVDLSVGYQGVAL